MIACEQPNLLLVPLHVELDFTEVAPILADRDALRGKIT